MENFERLFHRHCSDTETGNQHRDLDYFDGEFSGLAEAIENYALAGPERTIAIRRLQEAHMWITRAVLFPPGQ